MRFGINREGRHHWGSVDDVIEYPTGRVDCACLNYTLRNDKPDMSRKCGILSWFHPDDSEWTGRAYFYLSQFVQLAGDRVE